MRKYLFQQLRIFGLVSVLVLLAGEMPMNGLTSCELNLVLQADKQLSQKVGNNGCEALLESLALESSLLPRVGHLIKGRKSFLDILNKAAEKSLRCIAKWEPLDGRISASGTFAYTYGRYRKKSQGSPKDDPPLFNYYATVWRKHPSGQWQVLYNMGLINLKEWRSWDSLTSSKGETGAVEIQLMDVDREFSRMATRKGYLEAFYAYIADDGINISASGGSPANKETYQKRIEWLKTQTDPPHVQLIWEPILAHVASSEDLGFTTGEFTSTVTDASGIKTVQRGYYLSIWEKQPSGTWKFVFDGGNQVQE